MARKKKKNKSNLLIAWIIIIASLIVLGYFLYPRVAPWFKESIQQEKPPARQEKKEAVKTSAHPLSAHVWVNELDGSMMSLKGNGRFSIDFPSVESTDNISGQYAIDSNKIIFQYDISEKDCQGGKGTYNYTILDEKLELKTIDDDCDSRRELMTSGWFSL